MMGNNVFQTPVLNNVGRSAVCSDAFSNSTLSLAVVTMLLLLHSGCIFWRAPLDLHWVLVSLRGQKLKTRTQSLLFRQITDKQIMSPGQDGSFYIVDILASFLCQLLVLLSCRLQKTKDCTKRKHKSLKFVLLLCCSFSTPAEAGTDQCLSLPLF